MMKINTKTFGTVLLSFRHYLPMIEIDGINESNRLSSCNVKVTKIQGRTEARMIINPYTENERIYYGTAFVHPNDAYNKKVGRWESLLKLLSSNTDFTSPEIEDILVSYSYR